ncbi:Tripartite tricarboxylate transporter TctB family protein [Franzmannia pantelleriensis]|uniref:Tripartite tricarboxylate transporter TctB family protein n=1 Tax=Franzmannia pantelleriensis TaxID=48727 RepID=A0A1G9WNQ1_9GAMM|nr:tripartite tricarboxylate transporter TctB family protein [Halomonas pantelleriensis]SDM86184.1 Tripartite tricarboxylate transporter TctB family protein [Halomonas pantelleriensis]
MESGLSSFLSISIDFETSHLFFPRIVSWVMAGLFGLVVVTKLLPFLAAVRSGEKDLPIIGESRDNFRFFGSLALIIAYFYLMDVVGDMFPFTGYGFLYVSMIFVFLMSLLYMHEKTKKGVMIVSAISIIAPACVWFIMAKVFYITLP